MNNTKIDWADMTWNPATGCLNSCPYCYARRQADRFGLAFAPKLGDPGMEGAWKYDSEEGMDTMLELLKPYEKAGRRQPYPMGFFPTFHRYRLGEPRRVKKPKNIFVCSMSDLFGRWVPVDWIMQVMDACLAAPWHNYLFLTKNPARYLELDKLAILPRDRNFWYGTTVTTEEEPYFFSDKHNTFVSVEPMRGPMYSAGMIKTDWVIVGAETGRRSGKLLPRREWVLELADECREAGAPIFMKENLAKEGVLKPDEIVRQWPDGLAFV